jgi:hypothetical protein
MKLLAPLVLIFVLFLAATGGSAYFYNQYQKTRIELENLKKVTQVGTPEETQLIIDKVKKHMLLPQNEIPQIATITDKSKLASQPFFAKAKNGDKVLIYVKEKKAILYDPVGDRIVEVSPITLPEPTTSIAPQPTVSTSSGNIKTNITPYPSNIQKPTITYTPSPKPTSSILTPQ